MKKLVRQSVFLDLMGKTQVYAIEGVSMQQDLCWLSTNPATAIVGSMAAIDDGPWMH